MTRGHQWYLRRRLRSAGSALAPGPRPFQQVLVVKPPDVLVAPHVPFDRQWFGPRPPAGLKANSLAVWQHGKTCAGPRAPAARHPRLVRDLALGLRGARLGGPPRPSPIAILSWAQVFRALRTTLKPCLAAGLNPASFTGPSSLDDRAATRARRLAFRWNDPIPKAWSRRLSEREAAWSAFSRWRLDGRMP